MQVEDQPAKPRRNDVPASPQRRPLALPPLVACGMRLWLGLGVLLPLLAHLSVHPPAARAESVPTVVLLLPEAAEEDLRQVAIRLRAELGAAGFQVISESCPAALSPRSAMEQAARRDAEALVLLRTSAEGKTVAWISEGVGSTVTHAHLQAESTASSAQRHLTVQVADFLRARVASLAFGSEDRPPPPPANDAVRLPEQPLPVRRRSRIAVVGGALFLWQARHWELLPMPSLGLAYRSEPPTARALPMAYGATLSLAGYVPERAYSAEEGRATARQGLGTLEADLCFARGVLRPGALVGLGIYGVGVEGHASAPYRGYADKGFSPLITAGLFVEARMFRWLGLRAAGRAMHAPMQAHIEVAQREVGRLGGSMLSASLEVRAWLR
jgi:hypothetical protein